MEVTFFRQIIGYILLALIIASFYYSENMLFVTSIFFILFAMYEYRKMFKSNDICIHPVLPEIVGIFCSYVFIYEKDLSNHTLIVPALVLGVMSSFIITIIRNKKPYFYTTAASICAFLLIFCGLYMVKLTYYYNDIHSFSLICCYIFTVLLADWTASKTGPILKQKKIIFKISPNKSILGCISHTIVSCMVCAVLMPKFIGLTFFQSIFAGLIISIFAQFGDFSISLIKRDLNIKHSGNLFMNYGGILDRMDAFIFSAPALYYYLFIINII